MSRNLWSDRPLGMKLAALVAVGAVSLAVFAVITVHALQATGDRTAELLVTTHATGKALEADMVHDAVRGDVLQALLNGAGPLYDSAVADLRDHAATMHEVLAGMTESRPSWPTRGSSRSSPPWRSRCRAWATP
jgi:hypothetical protein